MYSTRILRCLYCSPREKYLSLAAEKNTAEKINKYVNAFNKKVFTFSLTNQTI